MSSSRFGSYWPLLPTKTLAAAGTTTGSTFSIAGAFYLAVQAVFTYVSGGTSCDVYIQTSLDLGATWIDLMNFHFLTTTATKVSAVVSTTALAAAITPGDAGLGANSILSGLFGPIFRAKVITTGTYTGATTLKVDANVAA